MDAINIDSRYRYTAITAKMVEGIFCPICMHTLTPPTHPTLSTARGPRGVGEAVPYCTRCTGDLHAQSACSVTRLRFAKSCYICVINDAEEKAVKSYASECELGSSKPAILEAAGANRRPDSHTCSVMV